MAFLFIGKLLLAWLILDLLLLCLLMLTMPSSDGIICRDNRIGERTNYPEAGLVPRLELPPSRTDALTDAELLRRLHGVAIDSPRAVHQARSVISKSAELLVSARINEPLFGSLDEAGRTRSAQFSHTVNQFAEGEAFSSKEIPTPVSNNRRN